VEFAFHSMVDLSAYGTTLRPGLQRAVHRACERVEGDTAIQGVFRVLAPGGWFCLDTPNGPVWRLRSAALMNADHKIEYSAKELQAKLEASGFESSRPRGSI